MPCFRRVEQTATGVSIVYTCVLDPATKAHRDGELFSGVIKAAVPSAATAGLAAV